MSRKICWNGMTGEKDPFRFPSSMHIVDYYNIRALREEGWDVVVGERRNMPTIGFYHQTWAPCGRPSFHYCCTSSTTTLPKSGLEAEKGHAAVFVLNNAMVDNFNKMGVRAHYWPHGVDPDVCEQFGNLNKFDEPTVISVAQGQFGPERSIKGLTWLVDTVLQLEGVNLIQVGAPWKPSDVLPLSDGDRKLEDLPDRIMFKGVLPYERTQALIGRSHALVTPSVGEGCPLPVLEAMNLGVPVVSTDLPYTHDWPFAGVIRRVPSESFVDVNYLHDQPFSPHNLNDYDIEPELYRPDLDRLTIVVRDMLKDTDWQEKCRKYRSYMHEHATWKMNLMNFALPIIEENL